MKGDAGERATCVRVFFERSRHGTGPNAPRTLFCVHFSGLAAEY